MTVMFGLRHIHKNKRLLAWHIVPICLFLVSLGVRLPNLGNTHSSPKPNPRAVIETSSQSSKLTVVKYIVACEFCDYATELLEPTLFPTRFLPFSYRCTSATPPATGARAPPVFLS